MGKISGDSLKSVVSSKYTFTLCSLLCYLVVVLIFAVVPPAGGYEYSLYSAYPSFLWVLVILLFVLPLLYIFVSVKGCWGLEYRKKTAWCLIGVSCMTLILMLYMPLIRGAALHHCGDTLFHLGVIYDILQTGYIPGTADHYPYIHVLGAIFTSILGVERAIFSFNSLVIFNIVFIIGMFCCARSIRLPHHSIMAITALSIIPVIPLITQEGIMPSIVGVQLLPLFIFLVYKIISKDTINLPYLILTVLFIVILWFVHPEITPYAAVFVLITLCVTGLSAVIKRHPLSLSFYMMVCLLMFQVLGYACFLSTTGYASFIEQLMYTISEMLSSGYGGDTLGGDETTVSDDTPIFGVYTIADALVQSGGVDVSSVTEEVVFDKSSGIHDTVVSDKATIPDEQVIYDKESGDSETPLDSIINNIGGAPVPFIDRVIRTINPMVASFIMLSFGGISLLCGFKKQLFKNKIYVIIALTFVTFCLISIAGSIGNYEMFGFHRLHKYPLVFAIFLCGFLFATLASKKSNFRFKKFLSVIFIIAIVIATGFSVFGLYGGEPWINNNNRHVTEQDITGMELFYTYSNQENLVLETGTRQHQDRYYHYLYGTTTLAKNLRSFANSAIIPPYQLGYDIQEYFGNNYGKTMYFLKNPPLDGFLPFLTQTVRYWNDITPTDYLHLDYDKSANLIQTGGDLEVYITSPTK